LEFIPKEIGSIYMANNPIGTLKHFPKKISGDLYITRSSIVNKKAISQICDVGGDIYEDTRI
jgi:dsRNA-specific ribonuclease